MNRQEIYENDGKLYDVVIDIVDERSIQIHLDPKYIDYIKGIKGIARIFMGKSINIYDIYLDKRYDPNFVVAMILIALRYNSEKDSIIVKFNPGGVHELKRSPSV